MDIVILVLRVMDVMKHTVLDIKMTLILVVTLFATNAQVVTLLVIKVVPLLAIQVVMVLAMVDVILVAMLNVIAVITV